MQVGKVMTPRAVCTRPEATLQEAALRMSELDVGSLPVCDNDRLVGMLTDRDITIRSIAQGHDPKARGDRPHAAARLRSERRRLVDVLGKQPRDLHGRIERRAGTGRTERTRLGAVHPRSRPTTGRENEERQEAGEVRAHRIQRS